MLVNVIRRVLKRKMIVLLPIVLFAAIAILAYLFYPTICFLKRFREGKPLPLCAVSVARTEVEVPKIETTVQIFRPDRKTHATLILVPGLHPLGIHDERFQSFATSCAESGFLVVAPDVIEFRRFQITPNAVELISNLVQALPTIVPAESLRNAGLLGISYGAGPVLVAASRKEVKNKIQFVVCIGGYFNLIHAMEYSVTGKHREGWTSPPPAHQWGRMIFALNHLEYLAPPTDVPLLHQIVMLHLNLKEQEAKEYELALSSHGKQFLNEVLNGLSDLEMERFKKMLEMHKEVSKQLSPEFAVSHLSPDLRVYLLHGPGDSLIPSAETEELIDALRKEHHAKMDALITLSLNHVDPAQKDPWMDQIRLLLWGRKLLSEASRQN